MADQRKIAAGVDLLLGQRAPAASEQEDEAKIKAGAQLLLGGNQPSKTQAVIPAATPPGVPYDPDFADFVGASAESFGVGLGDSLFAAKRGFYNLTLDFILDHTDAGKELVRMSRSPREAVKEALIQNAEALPRALPSTAAVLKIEDYLTDKLKRDLASRPTEVQENLAVQVSGAMGQITGTAAQAAIPGVGVGLAMTSGAAQGFNEVYEEARQKGATMGDAVVGALPSAAAAAVLEPLGARAATSVGKVFNRWNQRSGGAVERILDDLSKRAGTEAAKRVTGKAGEELIEVSMDKIFADAATAGLKRVPGGKALTGATGQAFGRIGRAGAVEFFGEGMEKVLANAGVNYATEQDVSLLRGVVDEGIVGGSAGALIRSVVETIVGIRARRGAGTIINISPKVGDTPLYNEDGTPIKMSEVMSGMTPEEMATKETQVVADAAASYRDQIIASRGQKDSPRYIPETVSTRELAIVISNERKIDMALATQAAERAKSMVAERLAREPLEPSFEPKVDPTNPMTWGGLTEEQATAAYDEEYSEYLAQLEKFNQRLEKQRAVAQKFGADYLGGVDDLDELRLQASNENARFWSEMYGDLERGVRTKRGPKGEEFAIPRTTVAKLQTTWQRLFNEEYALELMEADVKERGQVDLDTQRRNQAAIEQARANIEAYKQILAEEYRHFSTINGLYESGAERNAWKSYFQKQRELDPARAAIQAELLRNQNQSQVSPEERLKSRQQEIEAAAKKRAEDVKRAEERRAKVQAELLEQFPGDTPSPERKAQLDELKEYILTSYRQQKRVRTEKEQAEYEAFEAALPGLLNDFNAARSNAEQARAELKELEDDIYALRKDIEKAVSDRRLGTARELQAELDEKNGLLNQKKKQAAQADVRLREARDRLATYEAKPEEPPEAPPEAPPQPPQPPSKPPTKPPTKPPAAPAAPATPATPAVAPTPQVQAAPAAAAAKPSVVLEFKTGPQKEAWREVYVRIEDLPDNEDIIEQYGQDVIDELFALDDAANSISVSNKAADLLRFLFDDQRAMTEGAIQSKIYEFGTDDSGKPVTRQKIESQYRIYEKYLEQLDRALEEQAGQYAEEPTPAPAAPAAPTPEGGEAAGGEQMDPQKSVLPTAASVTVAPNADPRIASFFSGMGTVEAMLGKVSHVLAVEHEQDIVDAYNEAHGTKFKSASVFDINIDDVKDANPDLFHASPVCKEFSVAKFGQRNPDVDEVRSAQQIAKVIREVQPPAVTIENVPAYKDFPPFKDIVSALKEAGYKYRILIVDAADYGAAQRRQRLIVQAVRSGELPSLPEKTGPADWYEQTKDLLASAEESPMGPDELARIKSMIREGTLDGNKPIITMGGSAFKGKANASNSGGPAPTLPASPNQVVRVLFPDGRTVRVPSRALARLQGLPDSLTLPARATTAKKVLGNGVHGVITEKFIRPLLPASGKPAISPEPLSQIDAQVRAMLNPDSTKKFVFVAEGSPQPTQSLVTGSVRVYAVKLTGAKGGMRGTLYTTDLPLSMSARARAQREGGVTEQQLDQYLYSRTQGKPKDPGAVVVQRRDETGQVVVERASDPADAESVAETLAGQVPQGLTTVVTPDDAVSERQARVAAESGAAAAPAANATSAATRLNLPWGNELLKSAEQVLKAAGVKTAIAPQVFSALADSAKPLSIDALVGKVPHRKAAFAGSDDTPANHRIKVAEVLSRLVEAGLVIQQTAPDGKTYSSVSVQGEQKISQENAKLVQQSQARALGPQISFDRAAQQAGRQVLASANLGQLANKVFAEGDKRGVARRSALANSENVFLFLAQNDRELELDKDIVASVGVAPEPEPSGRIADDDEFFLPDPSGPAEGERRARRTKLLHALRLLSESGLVDSKGSRYFLTPKARQQFLDALKQTGGGFARPSKRGTELPAAPTAEPTVGRVMPGVDVWKSRVESALKSDPAGPFEFVSRQELSVLDPTVQETQDAIRGATDADLTRLLQSDAPVGFRRMATEMSIDPLTGLEVVSKVEAQLVRFDAKDVSRESWMVNRQLAWIEMRRRAQAASIKADLDRSARASAKYPPDRKGPYMRPRNPIKGRSMDPDMPAGYVRAPNGKTVPVFDDAGIGMTVTMEPATVLVGEPTNLADLRDAMNDVYNYIALTLTSDVGVLGIDGVYDPRSHAAVVGMTWDFGTVSHELSHGIVAWMHGRGEAGTTALVATMSKQVIDETTQLGKELYGPTVPPGGYEHEGLAEFFRIYMLSNEVAASNYPATYDWFQRSVLARDPKLAEKIADAQQMIDQYRFQGAEARSRASEVSREQRRRRVPILKRLQQSMLWTRFLQYWFSDVQSLYDMQSIAKANMVRLGKMTYEQAENDIALNSADYVQGLRSQASLLFRKWVTQHMTMADGRTPLEGGQSLDQAMLPMRGNRDDLMEYMRLMREEWLANQDEPRVSSIDPATRRTRIEALRAKHGDRIVLAHDNVHRWIKNVIGYCRANSPVFDKAFSDIDASGDTESWVPLQRLVYDVMMPAAMAEGDLRAFTDPAGVTTKGPARAGVKTRATEGPLSGSRSPSFNVLEELERNLSSLVAMTHKHMMIRSILDLANNNPILRGYIHKVQGADELFRSADRLDGDPLLSLGDNDALMNLESLRSMKDVNNDDRVLISVPVRADDGSIKLESYSVHKVVADAFGSLFPTDIVKGGSVFKSLDLIARLSSGTVKAFATGVFKPAFQLMIGPMMDFQTVWVNGSYPMGGFKLFYDYPMRYLTLGGEAVVETFGGKFLSKGTQLERTMNVGFESQPWLIGGKQSYFKSAGLSRGQRAVRYLNIANGDLMRLFERMISFPSKVGRQLSAENAAKQAGWDGRSPLTHSQTAAFIKYYDRTAVDWKQQGRLTRTINRYVPYFGVPFAANRDFVRATSDQLKDPKKRLQFGLKMAIQAGLAMAWWVMFDDEDEVKHLSYEEKSSRIPLPVPMADGSTETLLIPKAQSEMLMFSMMQAYLESKSTTDPMFWRNRGKAWVAAQLPGFLPGPIEAGGRALDLVNEEDVRKSVIDSIMPEAGYELSRPLIDYEKFMTPSELMNNPFGTIAGQKLAEITNGAITPRKFDAIVHAVAGQSVSNFEKALVMVGLAEDRRPKSAQGKIGDVPLFGSMFAARSGITMRSPYIRTLYALQENLMRQLRASREGVLTSNLAQKASDQMRIANHEAAARNGWATVMAINYIAQNMDGLTNKQRQDMMDHAGRVAENVVVSIYGNKVAPVYDPKMVMLPGTAGPVKTIKEIVETQQPGYQPKINLPKLFNLPNR